MKFFNKIILLIIFTAICGASFSEESQKIKFSSTFYKCTGKITGKVSLEQDIFKDKPKPSPEMRNAITPFTSATFDLDGETITLSPEKIEIKSDEITSHYKNSTDKDPQEISTKKMKIIASPSVIVADGESASISIESEQNIQYFEKREDGAYNLRETKGNTGLNLVISMKALENDMIDISKMTITLKSVDEREHLENVSLEVGMPIFTTQELPLGNMCVTSKKKYGILLGDTQGFIIIYFSAELVKDETKEEKK